MKITKFGHCCLLIEVDGVRILTDPGNYCETPMETGIDAVLITHEHQDHCHMESLAIILAKNPAARVITHPGVGKLLDAAGIKWTVITDREKQDVRGVSVQSFGTEHACIHHDLPSVQNTGFLIAGKLFYPGDSFHQPGQPVEVLALPVAGPWMKLEEAIEYAKAVKPKKLFPVHDGMLRQGIELGPTRRIPTMLLEPLGINYVDMTEGKTQDFFALL